MTAQQNAEKRIFGVRIDDISAGEALHTAGDWLHSHDAKVVVTPNPEILLEARSNTAYAEALNSADLALPDGYGMKLVGAVEHTVPGADFSAELLDLANVKKMNVMCIVRKGGLSSLQSVVNALREKAPDALVSGIALEKSQWNKQGEQVVAAINEFAPDIVFVGLGFPEQELWLAEFVPQLPSVRLAVGVGGTFDFWTGQSKRAPQFMRSMGLEWLWRVLRQPSRIVRILRAVVVFPVRYIFSKQ